MQLGFGAVKVAFSDITAATLPGLTRLPASAVEYQVPESPPPSITSLTSMTAGTHLVGPAGTKWAGPGFAGYRGIPGFGCINPGSAAGDKVCERRGTTCRTENPFYSVRICDLSYRQKRFCRWSVANGAT